MILEYVNQEREVSSHMVPWLFCRVAGESIVIAEEYSLTNRRAGERGGGVWVTGSSGTLKHRKPLDMESEEGLVMQDAGGIGKEDLLVPNLPPLSSLVKSQVHSAKEQMVMPGEFMEGQERQKERGAEPKISS